MRENYFAPRASFGCSVSEMHGCVFIKAAVMLPDKYFSFVHHRGVGNDE